MNKILYLSVSGMTEALGRSQVFEYLIGLSKTNKIYLISFERESDKQNIKEIEKLAKEYNIVWKYFTYSNKYGVFSTIIQISKVVIYASKLIKKESIEIIHSRSMIPAAMAVVLKKINSIKHLFDIRGFVFDEKVDSGRLNKNSVLYKLLKKLEFWLYGNSDYVITLTQKSKDIVANDYSIDSKLIDVIPTCASNNVFKTIEEKEKQKIKKELGFNESDFIIIHTGAVTNSYDFDSEVKLFQEISKINKNVKFLVVNKGQHDFVNEIFEKYKIDNKMYKVISSSFEMVHKYLNIADLSLFFIPPTYSKLASTPTKFAENLLCNLPSVTNAGVGDMDFYINEYDVGIILDYSSLDKDIKINAKKVLKLLDTEIEKKKFQKLYDEFFNKENAIKKYDKIYNYMMLG